VACRFRAPLQLQNPDGLNTAIVTPTANTSGWKR